jgi:hypothetical protein
MISTSKKEFTPRPHCVSRRNQARRKSLIQDARPVEQSAMRHNRSGQWTAFGAALLLLGGCSAAGSLFSSKAADSAGDAASTASSIADAVDWVTGPSDSFCRKEAGGSGTSTDGSGLIPVYKVTKGDCAEGDTALKEYDYNEIVAQNDAKTWDKLHAAAQAEATKPTYCRTKVAGIVYQAAAKACQSGESTITEEEYDAAKREAAVAATKMP